MKTAFLVEFDGFQFTHIWKIEEIIPGERIVYNWLYPEYEGEASLFLSDSSQRRKAFLKLNHIIINAFPDDIEDFSRESAENGWKFLINQNLKEYLDNKV